MEWLGAYKYISCVFFSAVSPLQFCVEGTQKSNGAVVCSAANSTIMIVLPSELRTHSIPAIIVPPFVPAISFANGLLPPAKDSLQKGGEREEEREGDEK